MEKDSFIEKAQMIPLDQLIALTAKINAHVGVVKETGLNLMQKSNYIGLELFLKEQDNSVELLHHICTKSNSYNNSINPLCYKVLIEAIDKKLNSNTENKKNTANLMGNKIRVIKLLEHNIVYALYNENIEAIKKIESDMPDITKPIWSNFNNHKKAPTNLSRVLKKGFELKISNFLITNVLPKLTNIDPYSILIKNIVNTNNALDKESRQEYIESIINNSYIVPLLKNSNRTKIETKEVVKFYKNLFELSQGFDISLEDKELELTIKSSIIKESVGFESIKNMEPYLIKLLDIVSFKEENSWSKAFTKKVFNTIECEYITIDTGFTLLSHPKVEKNQVTETLKEIAKTSQAKKRKLADDLILKIGLVDLKIETTTKKKLKI